MVNVVGGVDARSATTRATTAGMAGMAGVADTTAADAAGSTVTAGPADTAAPPLSDQDRLDLRTWRWRPASRRPVAAVASFLLTAVTALLARAEFPPAPVAYGLIGAALVLAAAGALAARLGNTGTPNTGTPSTSTPSTGTPGSGGLATVEGRGNRGLATVLLLGAALLGTVGAWTVADAHTLPGAARLAVTATAVVLALLLLGLFTPFARAGVIGAGAALGLTAGWELAALLVDGDPARLGALLAVVSVVLLGLLPRIALRATGLTAIDDRRSAGSSVSRHHVADALADTHRGLVVATVLTAASAAAAGWLLTRAEPTVWTVLATAVTGVVLLARARAFPLAVEVVAVFTAAAVLVVRLAVLWLGRTDGFTPLLLLAVAAALPLLALVLQPAPPLRQRLRRAADLVESIGVVGLLPLAVGAFGAYGHLLGGS
ncbi:type VII secretion integral membrane protein EccD [Streptomyces boluensis]|uniref:Type VII secretion integral membrane protein EccD n=1 Tax=Streptomyces boluensis TaxID=1775135 RepID=A0A964US38_9ACTN|nr:type VII secretion integral membrane protein EccD [Streptomyces boluensis]NBE53416.1 type VII secretion integral membrane protein EccD [Streptomyces boluensis]